LSFLSFAPFKQFNWKVERSAEDENLDVLIAIKEPFLKYVDHYWDSMLAG
jgi:hypothetical protein